MKDLDLAGRARHIEALMTARLTALQQSFPIIGDVRGRGAMLAIELVEPGTKKPNPTATATVNKACHAEGVLTLTCGTFGNVFRFLPPLVIEDHLVDEALSVLEKALADVS